VPDLLQLARLLDAQCIIQVFVKLGQFILLEMDWLSHMARILEVLGHNHPVAIALKRDLCALAHFISP
jgi:hypothetical protein